MNMGLQILAPEFESRRGLQKSRVCGAHKPQAERFGVGTYPGTALHEDIERVPNGYRLSAYLLSPRTGERVALGEYRGRSEREVKDLLLLDSSLMRRWQRLDRDWRKEWIADQGRRRAERRERRREWFKARGQADAGFRLNRSIRKAIYESLKGRKADRWEVLVGYTLAELRAHLEAGFAPGMAWENYGQWHVDHIRPLASFAITGPDCPEFKAAWALSNLQPLWGPDNLRKGARLPHQATAQQGA